jgi:hypothetical protein
MNLDTALDFPPDRSIKNTQTCQGTVTWGFPYPKAALRAAPGDGDSSEIVSFASLVALARVLQLNGLCSLSVGSSTHVSISVSADASLWATLSTLRTSSELDPTSHYLALRLSPLQANAGASSHLDGHELLLCHELREQELRLTLHYDCSQVTSLAALDLLQKIAAVIDELALHPECLVKEVSLLTESARSIVPDPSKV